MASWKSNGKILLAIPLGALAMGFIFIGHVHAQDIVPTDPTVPVVEPAQIDPPVGEPIIEATVEPAAEVAADPIITGSTSEEPLSDLTVNSNGDPYYTYLGLTHYFMPLGGSCAGVLPPNTCIVSLANTPIIDAIANVSGTVASGSVPIYVEGNHVYTENISISNPTKVSALNGTQVAGLYPQLNGTVTLSNLSTPFTLSGIKIVATSGTVGISITNTDLNPAIYSPGAITVKDVTVSDTAGSAKGVEINRQSGPVTLIRVHADGSSSDGLSITNTSGTLTITSSSFDQNGGNGLYIDSTGAINLNGLSAFENSLVGAYLRTIKPIVISNANLTYNWGGNGLTIPASNVGTVTLSTVYADHNIQYGLYIYTKGNVTLKDIRANYNNNSGIYVNTCNFSGSLCPLSGAVSITNAQVVSNTDTNLYVDANGSITLNTVNASSANGASHFGAYLVNNNAGAASAVTVNNGVFNNNPSDGLYILSRGNVSLNHITANQNYASSSYGMYIDNSYGTGTVTLLGTLGSNEFYSNDGYGIYIRSKGAISLEKFISYWNGTVAGDNNVYLDNSAGTGGVTVRNATIYDATGINLYIQTKGNTTLSDLEVSNSGQSGVGSVGAYIDNTLATGNPTVSVLRSSFTYNNSDGLSVRSKGTITLNTVRCDYNNVGTGGDGARLDATFGTGGVTIIKPSGTNLSFSSVNSFYQNDGTGLDIQAHGTVSIAGIDAYDNGVDGVIVDNSSGTGDVVLTDVTSRDNVGRGVQVHSTGAITYNTGHVYRNPVGYGIELDNFSWGSTVKPVTLSAITTYENADDQLYILTRGAVTIKTIEAYQYSGTGYQGIHIQVNGTSAVTMGVLNPSDSNDIYGNPNTGLYIRTSGPISLTNVDSYGNTGGYGVDLNNPASTGAVTITNSTFNNNSNYGIYVVSQGAITLKGGSASSAPNTGGAYLENSAAVGTPAVSISSFTFDSNFGHGLEVRSRGAISLTSVEASSNNALLGSYGVYLNNTYGTGTITVTGVLGTASTSLTNNDNDNLHILSNGAVTLNAVGASDSHHGYGTYIDNSGGTGAVSITSSNFDFNPKPPVTRAGLYINSSGVVSLTSVSASYNGDSTDYAYGAYINTTKAVTVKTGWFNSNRNTGLYVLAGGNISLTNVEADYNGYDATNRGDGAYLVNTSSASATVTVVNNPALNFRFYNNWRRGLAIYSNGKVTLTGIETDWNRQEGLYVDNYTGGSGVGDVVINKIETWENDSDGMHIISLGAVTLNLADVYYNGYSSGIGTGCILDNSLASSLKPVLVTKSSFINFNGTGLDIQAHGSVTLNGITAQSNDYGTGYYGVNVVVTYAGSAASVTVLNTLGANTFKWNNNDGLRIASGGGNVSLNGVTANENYDTHSGVHILGAGNVTVTNSVFEDNSQHGLWVEATGNITLSNITATSNNSYGATLNNTSGSGTVTVTVSKSTFNTDNSYGLLINTNSLVTLNGVQASDNYNDGVDINNTTGTGGVTILSTLGSNIFNGNNSQGLLINTNGAVTASKVYASDNSGSIGAEIHSASTVTLTTGTFNNNRSEGLKIFSNGLVTLSGIMANVNGVSTDLDGIYLDTTSHDVLITNSVVIANGKIGINALIGSGQKLVLTNVLCVGNSVWGGASPDVAVSAGSEYIWN